LISILAITDPGNHKSLGFFVVRVLAATRTELAELQAPCGRLLVFGRGVIALFAITAL
jgi:hypothetical protein